MTTLLGRAPACAPWPAAGACSLRWRRACRRRGPFCWGGGGDRHDAESGGAGRVDVAVVVGAIVGPVASAATPAHTSGGALSLGPVVCVSGWAGLMQLPHRRWVRARHCLFEKAAAGSARAQAEHFFLGPRGFVAAGWVVLGFGFRTWDCRSVPSAPPASVHVAWVLSLGLQMRSMGGGRVAGGSAPSLPRRGPAASARVMMAVITRWVGGCTRPPSPSAPGPQARAGGIALKHPPGSTPPERAALAGGSPGGAVAQGVAPAAAPRPITPNPRRSSPPLRCCCRRCRRLCCCSRRCCRCCYHAGRCCLRPPPPPQ